METKKLIILFIGILLVSACTREVVVTTHGEEPQEKVPVSLRIQWDEAVRTKAGDWEYDKYFPEIREEEQKVSNIFLVVFKDRFLEQYDYYLEGNFIQQNDYSILLETEDEGDLLELEPGPHFFYAILNIPIELQVHYYPYWKVRKEY
ncbi:MAG: hypothetical protein LUE98_21280 [Tannerellaceae bacterium]|nr:hypothetical protein [Tannerellaceae bacterium]